jgi:hypothetical protein
MTEVRFLVETTFDLGDENGILAPGQLLTGAIGGGTTLRTESTGRLVRVLAVEFRCSAVPKESTNGVTLVIDRADTTAIEDGTVLIGPA